MMALDLTDEDLDALAERARKVLNAPTRKDAVRQALERVVESKDSASATTGDRVSRAERLSALQKTYQSMGTPDPKFDEKKYLDAMWDD